MTTKKPLYIFMHVFKCAGTTLREHILKNFKEGEVLILYRNEPPYFSKKEEIEKYINSLTRKQRDKIKVIFGHEVYYGIHNLFSNRRAKYITFFRDIVDRIISHYNFRRQRLGIETENERLKKQHIRNGKILKFKEWFLLNDILSRNFVCRFLLSRFCNIKIRRENIHVNEKNLEKIKDMLDKFYFIGIVEKQEDFLFLYHELGINKFSPNINISKKYFLPKDYEKTKKFILSKNKYDLELYNYALKLNKKFKEEHKEFYRIVKNMEIKREKDYKKINSYLILLKHKVLQLIYKLSEKLKKHSKLYTKFVDLIKDNK